MALTTQWLIDSNSTHDIKFELLAGDTSANTPITGVNIMDNPDTIPWLLKGTLVLSTGYLFLDDAFTQNLIQNMVDKGCSGLGIKMNRYIDKLPDTMVQQANQLHFPIISVPFSSSMNQITAMIYRKMFDDELNEAMQMNLIYKELSECILKKQSIKHMLPIIGNALNCDAFLTNDSFDVIENYMLKDSIYTYPFSFAKENYTLFSETDCIYLKNNYENNSLPYLSHTIPTAHGTSMDFELFPISNRNSLIGFLILLKEKNTLTNAYDFIQSIQTLLCIAMMHFSVLTESERSSRDIFFHNLLSESYKDLQETESMCMQNGFNVNLNRICICLESPEYQKFTIAQRRAMERKIFSLLQSVSNEENIQIMRTVFQTHFIFFIFPSIEMDVYSFSQICISLSTKWLNTLNAIDENVKAGISSVLCGCDTITTCYKQAVQTLDLGSKLHDNCNLFSYTDDIIFHHFINHFSRQDLKKIYDDTLGILEQYDLKNNSQLVETLDTYLNCQQNISQTAKILYIHRNTMFYRLDQIKELLHLDFTNRDVIFRIQAGFYIRKLLY